MTLVPALVLASTLVAMAGRTERKPAPTPTPAPTAVTTPETGAAGSTVPAPRGIEVTWHGQSCFLMRTPGGTTVLMDPVAFEIGYRPPTVRADLVTISHEHPDHNNLKMVEVAGVAAGGATVLHGLDEKRDWAEIDASVGDVRVFTVPSFHDEVQGKKRGKNAIFVFDVAGARLVHLGDLGHLLTKDQLAKLGTVDVLMVPIGGHYTIDAAAATRVVEQVKPRFVIFPMHYKTDALKIEELAGPEAFLEGRKNVVRVDGSTFTLETPASGAKPPEQPVIVLLKAD